MLNLNEIQEQVRTLAAEPLPLLPLRHEIVLPGGVATIPVGRPRSRALAESVGSGDFVVLGAQRDPSSEDPALADLLPLAVLARVKDKVDRGRRGLVLVVEPLARVALSTLVKSSPFWMVRIEPVSETRGDESETEALVSSLGTHLKELSPEDAALSDIIANALDAGLFADRVVTWLEVDHERRVRVLGALDATERLRLVTDLIAEAKARAEIRQRIDSEVRRELTKGQREAVLRQQLRALQKELGDDDEENDLDGLRAKLAEADLPPEVRKISDRELKRLSSIGPNQAESNVIRTYLEWLVALPWTKRATPGGAGSDDGGVRIDAVAKSLDDDHYGLDEVKRRILEHMAVLKLSGNARGTILCLIGPPGVGKTSLAQSVAKATGRPLVRISLGGVRDEAEIRGHRRTYVGAMPGRLIAALRKAEVKNPVLVLDEIDKLGRGWAGDPEAALLEVLDPEQNKHFTDHYLETPFDLSEVLFIATANELGTLSPPLRDRLEIIEVAGYTTDEKVRIAQEHLVPKQLALHGISADSLALDAETLEMIVRDYTREAGVRQLSREIAKLCRSVALTLARRDAAPAGAIRLTTDELRKVLGRRRFESDVAERMSTPGVAAGLAWTPVGGDILYIETTRMPGKGRLEITGQLGDVMKESARAALAFLRSRADEFGVDPDFLEKNDLHLHVPAGAVPKDGPSAGVTIFTAFGSLLTGRRARSDTAMTGEATLRGRVLPVGGIKSKVLAAHRAGFTRVILPKRNEHDVDEVPESVRAQLEFIFADDMRDVLEAALEPDVLAASDGGTPSRPAGEEKGSIQRVAA